MDRIRDGRRGGGMSVGGGPPPPRRRLRSNGGGGPRDSPRSERRRGERLMLNGGGGAGRDDGDDTSDDSLGDDDDDAEEELAPRYQPAEQRRSPSTAPPPPSPPQHGGGPHHSSSSSGGGGGYHNHHHHHGQPQQMQRKGGSSQKSPIVLKAADEMIGVPVPRKARSASMKRSSHEWPVPGGGAGAGDSGSQIQRPSSRPISPASASTTAPARKKLKPLGGGGSSFGSGPPPKQRPSPSSAPSTTPPQPPPPKISKSPSFIQEEIEVAEVLFGLTRQFPCPPKPENNHKLEHRDAQEAKSGNSSPAPSSSGARPSDFTSLTTIAPKRKRPRLVKYDEDSRPASPTKQETAEPSSKPEAPPAVRSEAKASTSATAESGASTTCAAAQVDAPREAKKMEDRGRGRDTEPRTSESDRRDHRPESRPEPPAVPSGKPDGEATLVGSEAPRNGEATATTKIELASDGVRQEKFCIDLMAPPPGKLSPDRDGAFDPDADKKGLDSGMDMTGRANSGKKDGERTRRVLDIDLEDQKVQRIPADELAPMKLTLQLDLEKPSLGDETSPSEHRQPQPPPLQQQHKSSKSEIKHEKSAVPAVTPPMPLPVGGWLGSFPPFGYLGPVPALSAAGLHPMDIKPGSSSGLPQAALIPPPPTRSKRCATHCFVAQLIQYHQRIAKMNSFWPPAAAAAAAAANRSGPFFGTRPFNMGVLPPTDATSLVNPMQGSYPVRAHTPLQESKAPTIASSPFQAGLSKDKAALSNAAGAESSQRKQPPAHETQQSTPMPNMLQGPAFIFPFNQQQATAMAAASAANRAGDAKSSGASNVMQPSGNAHATAANPGAMAMNLSFANLQPADAQFLAILQNGAYPFQVAAHAGGPPSYRGMAPSGPAVPYFNGHVYPSHMLHPSQHQVVQQQCLQKNPMPSLSNCSQKHQPQSQGLLGYTPNANPPVAAAANNSQNYSSSNQRSVLVPGHTHRQDSDKTGQDGPSSDDKPSHPQKGGYDHNFAVPVHLPNFSFAAQAPGSQNEKKLSDHHNHQQQPQASRGQGVRIDLASSQPFVMPFGSIGPPGSASTGLDFSSLAQSHAMFQSHHEAARHGYPQLNFAAAQSAQTTQHKAQNQIIGETKSVAGDSSSTPSAGDNERKKSASTKYPGDSQQHSLSFSRTENKSYGPPFLTGNSNEGSSHTLSLMGAESPNAFGSKSTSSSTPASAPAAASSTFSQMQHQQQQQHFLQIHQKNQQQYIQQRHLNRPRSAAPSTPSGAGGYQDRLSMANFQSTMYPSGAAQGGAAQSQSKASSTRVTASSATVTAPAAPSTNLIVMKNSGLHQQQAKGPMQVLSSPAHQSQSSLSLSSSKMGPSVANISTGGDLSRSSNAPVASGSPSNSVSKSTGGSPPATGSAKGVQQSGQLSSPQQSAKNPASTSGSKSTPTSHYNMPMPSILGQQPIVSPASNPGGKQQSHMPPSSMKHQPFPQSHFFISNAYAPQASGPGAAAALGHYQKRSGDKTQQPVPHQQNAMSAASNNMKVLHPPSSSFMHLAAAGQSAGGVPHSHMSAAQLTFGAMPMPVKPSSDKKPAAGK